MKSRDRIQHIKHKNRIRLVTMSSISILLLGDSLTEGYTQHGIVYHSYGIQLKKRFEESGKDVEVNAKQYRF